MIMDVLIGFSCFICGFLVMFAIHRVVFDYYEAKAEATIRKLKHQQFVPFDVEITHKYAVPDDVEDLKFNE